MKGYDHKIFSGFSDQSKKELDWTSVENHLNELATEGWEVISTNINIKIFGKGSHEMTVILRRPLAPPQ